MEGYLKKIKSILQVNKYISDFFLRFIDIQNLRKNPEDVVSLKDTFEFNIDLSNYHIASSPYWKQFKNIESDPIFYAEIPDATIVSKGIVVTSKKQVILESTIFQKEYLNELYSNHFVVFNKLLPSRKEHKVLSLQNKLDNNYFHWTMESLFRILVIYENPAFQEYNVLIKDGGSRFMFDSLQFLFQLPKERIITKRLLENIKADKAMVVSFPHIRDERTEMTNTYYPYLIRKFNQLAHKRLQENIKNIKTNMPKNILVSRKNAIERRIVNEDDFLQKLKKFDFNAVYLEELTFVEQVSLFYGAENVIVLHGAGITNIIYGKNPLLIELFPKERKIRDAFYFAQITSALQFKHEVIFYNSYNTEQDVLIDDEMFNKIISKLTD